jgi:hypothetical protein
MVDHRTRTTHAEKNQGEIFKVKDQSRGQRYLDAFLPHLTYYEFKRWITGSAPLTQNRIRARYSR